MVGSSESSGYDELLHVAAIKEVSTLLGDMDADRATLLLREKFIDYGVHVYKPRLVRCDKFGEFIRIMVQKLKRK